MNPLLAITAVIFAVLMPLFMLEAGVAMLFLARYDNYKARLAGYISLSWEISGTFLIFYLVNAEATLPGLLAAFGTIYSAPIIVAGVLVIMRNAFLAYSRFAGSPDNERRQSRIYAASTAVAAFLIITIISSALSGNGASLGSMSADLPAMALNPLNIAAFFGFALLSLASALVFFGIHPSRFFFASAALGIILLLYSMAQVPYITHSIASDQFLLALPVAVFLAMAFLYVRQDNRASLLVFPLLFVSALVAQAYAYPFLFNGTANVTAYMPPQADAFYIVAITAGGAALLAIALGVLFYARRLSRIKGGRAGY